jgi:hypothetical protein
MAAGSKTTIVGTLTDSLGNPLTGRLDVTLNAPMAIALTTPDTILTVKTGSFTITNGVLNISLFETQSSNNTYHFAFYPTVNSVTSLVPLYIDFSVEVPDTSGGSIEFSVLVPSGIIINSGLTSGALRVARAMLTDPQLLPLIVAGLGQRTYSGENYYFNGTVWRSRIKNKTARVLGAIGSSFVYEPIDVTLDPALALTVESASVSCVVNAPNDASNKFTIATGYLPTTAQTLTLFTASTVTSNTAGIQNVPINVSNLNKTLVQGLGFNYTKSGSPGSANIYATFNYYFVNSSLT